MLGIDIGHNEIRIVNLRQRRNKYTWQDPLIVSFTAEQGRDPQELGRMLGRALQGAGWEGQKAVMTLPRQHCFIRYFDADSLQLKDIKTHKGHLNKNTIDSLMTRARKTMLVPEEQLIFDLWSNAEGADLDATEAADNHPRHGGVLIGAAQKEAVEFCRELATAGGIKIQSLELRPLAAINGMLFHWHEAQEENIAVAYLQDNRADVGIMDADRLISLQSVSFSSAQEEERSISENHELSENMARIFNTARLSRSDGAPQKLFLAQESEQGQAQKEKLTEEFRQKLGIEVSWCSCWDDIFVQKNPSQENISQFIPAIGAALDGLGVSPVWFNFLHPRGRRIEKKRRLSWRPFALLGAAAAVLTCVFWISLVQQKRQTIRELKDELILTGPNLEITRQAREKWRLFHSYLPAARQGTRCAYLNIIGEISQLFPETDVAHVTRLEIISRPGAAGYNVSIAGNVSESMVLNDFVARLNESAMFQEVQQAGTTLVPGNLYYPYSFSVNCNLRSLRATKENE